MTQKPPVYMDYAATTPVDPRVYEVMQPYFHDDYGNPSSIHRYGQLAESAVEDSREVLAQGLNCNPKEVVFTSCGSESDNLALRGVALAARETRKANHILISPVEHHAVFKTAQQLAQYHGFELEFLPVDSLGLVDPAQVQKRLRKTTAVVSVIYANNEIGSINPISDIGTVCQNAGIPFHTDAVQAAAYLPVDVQDLHVDLLSLGAHKFYGPKGVGALYIRSGITVIPSQTGGGQEHGLRAGTHNVAFICAMAKAFALAASERQDRIQHVSPLRDYLVGRLLESIPDCKLTGHPVKRLPNHASFVFEGVDGNALLMLLDLQGYACSSGSACKTGDPEPSEVLTALGFSREWALGSLRITLGSGTTTEHVHSFSTALPGMIENARFIKGSGS